jgi:hypothetical protein
MRLFFVGNYQGTLEALQQAEQQSAPSSRLRSHRACSPAGLALSANPRDTARLGQAHEHYRQLLPGMLRNDRRYISPKILRALGAS